MSYITLEYYVLVVISVVVYYLLPQKIRWIVLLIGSGYFYYRCANETLQIVFFIVSIIISYLAAHLINCQSNKKLKIFLLFFSILLSAVLLIISKCSEFLISIDNGFYIENLIVPLGLSFYTLQTVAYLVDVYYGKISPQKNLLKYALFISFFPQLIQGPIPRYEQLGNQLFLGTTFNYENITNGFQLIIWGFFLKLMIADKAAIVVNTIFDHYQMYAGMYVIVAGVLYSIQLYSDFLACTVMAKGVSKLFGIDIIDNFSRPYFATSIQDFWRRWHISLSSWLRDYVYIPLGGNRRGKLMKYVNLILTFAVSGLWHGGSLKFLFWGLMHAFYQIIGNVTLKFRNKLFEMIEISPNTFAWKFYRRMGTFIWVMLAWIIFRAENLHTGFAMIKTIFTTFNPWILLNGTLNAFLDYREWEILIISIGILIIVGHLQERMVIREWIADQHITIRWGIYLCAILAIWIFGTYGVGFDAQAFIYGGF